MPPHDCGHVRAYAQPPRCAVSAHVGVGRRRRVEDAPSLQLRRDGDSHDATPVPTLTLAGDPHLVRCASGGGSLCVRRCHARVGRQERCALLELREVAEAEVRARLDPDPAARKVVDLDRDVRIPDSMEVAIHLRLQLQRRACKEGAPRLVAGYVLAGKRYREDELTLHGGVDPDTNGGGPPRLEVRALGEPAPRVLLLWLCGALACSQGGERGRAGVAVPPQDPPPAVPELARRHQLREEAAVGVGELSKGAALAAARVRAFGSAFVHAFELDVRDDVGPVQLAAVP